MSDITLFILCLSLPFGVTLWIFLWEKNQIWPYSDEYKGSPFVLGKREENFAKTCMNYAVDQEFDFLGLKFDGRGGFYKVQYYFFVSSDRKVIFIVGSGTLMNQSVSAMWLYSRTFDGTIFLTITHQNAARYDLSGMVQDNLISTSNLRLAYSDHLGKMRESGFKTHCFSKGMEEEELKALFTHQVEVLRQKKYIYFCDKEQSTYRHTLKGATKRMLYQLLIGLFRMPASYLKAIGKRKK